MRLVFPAARSGPAIIAASEEAWRLGVRPGMPLAEARSMAQPLVAGRSASRKARPQAVPVEFQEWQPLEDRQALIRTAELTRRYAPIVGLDRMAAPDCLVLDITGCGALFGSESTLAELLLKDLRNCGLQARIAIADTLAAVWAFAHFDGTFPDRTAGAGRTAGGGSSRGKPGGSRPRTHARGNQDLSLNLPVLIMPPGQQEDLVAQLPLSAARLLPQDISVLSQLGLLTIGQLKELPREDLPARLSANAVTRIRQLAGIEDEGITAIPEASPIAAEWSSEFPAKTHNDLLQVMDHLVKRICEQLERRRVGCVRLNCQFSGGDAGASGTEDAGAPDGYHHQPTPQSAAPAEFTTEEGARHAQQLTALQVEAVKPTQSPALLMEILGLRLESLKTTTAIHRVQMTAVTAPLPVGRQKDLFDDTRHFVPSEELATLITRLNSRLGANAVLVVDQAADVRPEHAVRLTAALPGLDPDQPTAQRDDFVHLLTTPAEGDGQPLHATPLPRPVRLLPVPVLLPQQDSRQLWAEGITWEEQNYSIQRVLGPERLQTAWWQDVAIQRDYYRVITTAGAMFWIYRELTTGQWWLHGIFD